MVKHYSKMKKIYYLQPDVAELHLIDECILCQSAGIGDMGVEDGVDNDSFI